MIGRTLSLGLEKPKFTKFFVSNQILGEVYICIVWVWNGLIKLINTTQSYLFMTQVYFMLFLKFWVRSIQALPNPVRCFPHSRTVFLITPNMYGKYNEIIYNTSNHIWSLILYLPIDSSTWFSKKNKVFQSKTFSYILEMILLLMEIDGCLMNLSLFQKKYASNSVIKNKIKNIEEPIKEQGTWIFADIEYKVDKKITFTWN